MEGFHEERLVRANLFGIGAHRLHSLRLVAHLPDQPVGYVMAVERDTGSSIPQSATETRLHDGAVRVVAPNGRIGLEAVGTAFFCLANDLAAEVGEVAGRRYGSSIGLRDNGSHAGSQGELILDALNFIPVEQFIKRDRAAFHWLRQHEQPIFNHLLYLLALSDVVKIESVVKFDASSMPHDL